ncbi:alkaline phosphatase family protein [Modestobacter muralis]|uniref:Alkaline phosphatase family protein n=1 Tax=Modestobacter muralis TaxID=1608614 RepID=A0A6P0H9C8_9ACTN|nr:alkaline phosphatase D family protein [Modestobacter muralis]NEK95590.1 alkaline phosphatase family protein [Modestobacter muralis]NEN52478.1 alkaline phosphatase family protein [Modestobacter muralis]
MPETAGTRPLLLLGPLLRHVDPVSATLWVETDRACEVEVLGHRARTFRVNGHHYALVVVEGLAPGSVTPYEVHLDGARVWPPARSVFPPSRIRTTGGDGAFRLAFGSCRYATPTTVDVRDGIPPDALDSYARRLVDLPEDQWPDALVLLGDQVYADEITPATRDWLAARRDLDVPPGAQAADFEEYTRLYLESWGDPQVRWLLSTVPASMVFDDHEMIDDWNTSAAWREEVTGTDWWQRRISGGLVSYWVYQHLGNLSPNELADDDTWQAIAAAPDEDAGPLLDEMARIADTQPHTVRWSYVRHWGTARLIMVDSRAGRVLTEDDRKILDDEEFDWVEAAVARSVEDDVEHVLIGTSLPWLLPHSVHDLERWNETLSVRHAGKPLGRLAEALRQAADLEHWAAFGQSFERLGALMVRLGRGELGRPPATALVLSGDVHHAYAAELVNPGGLDTRVHQLTVSPLHNSAPHAIEIGFKVGWSRWAQALTGGLRRLARVERSELRWAKQAGPFFGNELGELVLEGRNARFLLWATSRDDDGAPRFTQVLDTRLS